jgi:hypothetical protein
MHAANTKNTDEKIGAEFPLIVIPNKPTPINEPILPQAKKSPRTLLLCFF